MSLIVKILEMLSELEQELNFHTEGEFVANMLDDIEIRKNELKYTYDAFLYVLDNYNQLLGRA